MPVMSGDDAIRDIRASNESYCDVPIIALTADATKEAEAGYLAIGASGYLSKPLHLPDVLAAIEQSLKGEFSALNQPEGTQPERYCP